MDIPGTENDFPERISSLPYKKKRNQQELSKEEKEYNKIHSTKKEDSNRGYHHCRLKKNRIMSEVFRNKLRKYNIV